MFVISSKSRERLLTSLDALYLANLDNLKEQIAARGPQPNDLEPFKAIAIAKSEARDSRPFPLKTALLCCLALGWIIPSPITSEPAEAEKPAATTSGTSPFPISFGSAVSPVRIMKENGELCRSHRGLHRLTGISSLRRCDMLSREAIGLKFKE
jgi:hypothetical protein